MRPAPRRALALFLLLAPLGVAAGPDPAAGQTPVDLPPPPARPAVAEEGVAVVPDRFLRRWDPVTLFFPSALGPARGGPEERPERFVTLSPGHPGAFSWLDARTLQFQPAEPWPALARVTVTAAGRSFALAVLLPAPLASHPADGAEGIERLDEIALTFPDPVDPAALAGALSLEIAPLPGVGADGARAVPASGIAIKPLPRGADGSAAYALRLAEPVPGGHRLRLRLHLAPGEGADGNEPLAAELVFATATPVRAVAFGCRERQLPVLPAGARYPAEQALACEADDPAVVVDFSALPRALGIVEARNLVRLSPPVADLTASLSGRRLELRGPFARETAYRLRLVPAPLSDETGRPLDLAGANELVLSFPRPSPYLRLAAATGIAERRGPQMVPLAGRGEERIDLRIHRIDPLDRAFWPFPATPVAVDEERRPPGPGERPAAWERPESGPSPDEIAARIAALGSPSVSAILDLPLRRDGGSASFGLDLQPHRARLAGDGAPGTYLVGLRRLDGDPVRRWLRLQVSDLSLTTLEEARRTVFLVTSLATAQPVAGAEVRVEGVRWAGGRPSWIELFRARTDGSGRAAWRAPGSPGMAHQQVARISVAAGEDLLVLDPERAPESYHDGRWSADGATWLQWTQGPLDWRGGEPERLAHLFTERPVYRPEEPVHLMAYQRTRSDGRLTPLDADGVFVIDGPGDLVWRYPVTPEENGSAYLLFDEPGLPTGTYRARFETLDGEGAVRGAVSFRKEAYRLPRFEVRLDGPERTPLDRPFELALAATYYAGGRVAARPVEWRVTQFPHDWAPAGRPGFLFSSDARFAGGGRFESTPAFARADTTDEDGGARLRVDPGVEPTAQPRVYVVEATVVDVDEQTVTATRQVVALPPLLLGLSVPRYLEQAGALRPK
ncbi:MAG TPA: alpha-2-macroglobulin, partial [Thermoanaerobaculia bacterium]|nr:alpha-2-macroglobulin [Thermoanaerobaculia bacterium]